VLAVAAVALALYLVITTSIDSKGDGDGRANQGPDRKEQRQEPDAETYVIQPGDSLGSIAAQTGVSVERLSELNPEVDPQALQAGNTIRLR
jgi:LysM repeat protein